MILSRRILARTLEVDLFDRSLHRSFAVLAEAFSCWGLEILTLRRNGRRRLRAYCKGTIDWPIHLSPSTWEAFPKADTSLP